MDTIIITSEADIKAWLREIIRSELAFASAQSKNGTLPIPEPLLTRAETAAYLHISLKTLADWTNKGLPCIKKGRRILFLKSEVLAALKGQPRRPSRRF